MREIGCFQERSCVDIGEHPDEGKLDAALCGNNNYVSFCACCQNNTVLSDYTPPACDPWPPKCAMRPPSASPGYPPSHKPKPSEGVEAINKRRTLPVQDNLRAEATSKLHELMKGKKCAEVMSDLANQVYDPLHPGEKSFMVAGGTGFSWEDTVNRWLSLGSQPTFDGRSWTDLPTPLVPYAMLASAGITEAGCVEDPNCGIRLCLVRPNLSANGMDPLNPAACTATSSAC